MRWDYNDDYRDDFGKGVHRDILIVPHATNVTKVSGGPPLITSKVPKFNSNGQPTNEFQDVDWVIDNSLIVKEKFKYSFNLNPNDNISFSCAASAMVQFTIRNNKEYNPDTNRWELDIPNLQYYSFTDENNNVIVGELDGNYIIKVYEYFNGDSDTLIYLGMFRVEEDKAVDNGYNRQITAYDFMLTFREMDIFNWYRHLFEGINKLDNDYLDATNKSGEETKKPDNYDDPINWIRPKQSKWTVKDALEDLINNLAAYDMIVYSDSGEAMVGCTTTNPSTYGRDYGEGAGYSGLGMPIMLDPDLFDSNAKYSIPTEPGEDQFEHYGYMKISELEFMQDPSIMSSGSLSMGKFLEDIGILAGRYPYIRTDYLEDDDYHDPSQYEKGKNRYNNYEKCILTFKPLPSSKEDKTKSGTTKLQPEQTFSNHEIVKGFQHEQFQVKDVMIVKIGFNDKSTIEFKRLNKSQRDEDKKKALQTFSFSNNMFCSYLIDESDDDDIKPLIPEYKKIKEKLFGTLKKNGNMTADSLFEEGYLNIKYRNYVPYKLTTFCDPVRDVGDRIQINFEDKITGELTSFYTYILSREIEGVQKQMDTYNANGQMTSPVFSNYQSGTSYQSGTDFTIQMLGYRKTGSGSGGNSVLDNYVTPSDLISYLRNVGIRLLDEPIVASAKFVSGGEGSSTYNCIADMQYYSMDPSITRLHDGDTTNPVTIYDHNDDEIKSVTAVANDYITNSCDYENVNEYYDTVNNLGIYSSMYIYTANGDWAYSGLGDMLNHSASNINFIKNIDDFFEGSTQQNIVIKDKAYIYNHSDDPEENSYHATKYKVDTAHYVYTYNLPYQYYDFSYMYDIETETTVQARYGTYIELPNYDGSEAGQEWQVEGYTYIYPGVWAKGDYTSSYPEDSEVNIKKHVELKWEDPGNATKYEPYPAEWQGTVIVRKEDSPPKHRWDGVRVVYNTTKDQYKDTPYKDEDIELGKVYYYGFFPYYKKTEIDGHAIRFYRFTKVIKVETGVNGDAPVINNIMLGIPQEWDGSEVAFAWSGSNKITVAVASSTITFKMYTGDSVIYTFDAAYGSTIEDVNKINMGFLVDDTNQVAKPSFTYESNNAYSYNQEEPTDSEMGDIYTWLQG